jgi:predicted AAA+ superfamily ATPase
VNTNKISRELLKRVYLEQNERLSLNTEGLITRELFPAIFQSLRSPECIVITGIRRCGKSTLHQQLRAALKVNSFYLSFEDERLISFRVEHFELLHEVMLELSGESIHFFLDEIQNVRGWERFVRRMQDGGAKFIITGSNASLLSSELGTKLTGRHLSFELFPFSFREFLAYKKGKIPAHGVITTKERAEVIRAYEAYLQHGGMPGYLLTSRAEYLKSLYDDVIFRDIVARYKLSDAMTIREVGVYLATNAACRFTYNSVAKALEIKSSHTVKKYVYYLENSYLFFQLMQFTASLKQSLRSPKKNYSIDLALQRMLSLATSKNLGAVLENLIFLHLKRKYRDIWYYVTADGYEVDFLVRVNGKQELVQVCNDLSSPETREREIRALSAAMKELKTKKAMIVTKDDQEVLVVKAGTITVVPAWQWLLA